MITAHLIVNFPDAAARALATGTRILSKGLFAAKWRAASAKGSGATIKAVG
jgi:hypothetical protein